MKDINKLQESLTAYGLKLGGFIAKYRVVLTLAVACLAIFAAVIQAQEFLNPTRDETTYSEAKSQVNIRNIDQDVLNKLKQTQDDQNQTADSDFVPGRSNPFAE